MDIYGNMMVSSVSYADKDKVKKVIQKTVKKLRPGLLKVK
jgi:hypothetical protein